MTVENISGQCSENIQESTDLYLERSMSHTN